MARKLKKILADTLSSEELSLLIGGYDLVGDMAIIIVPDALQAKERLIAQAVLESNRQLKVVAKRSGFHSGEFRTIPLDILAGENRKEAEVREFGLRLLVNPETVYYSVRSGAERRRIASLVCPKESVLVLFSGVAPYPLMISRYSKVESIVGIEKNPQAHVYALLNLKRNAGLDNIRLFMGDVKEIVPSLGLVFDRVIMPLPTMAEEFLPCAFRALRPGGFLHYYDLQHQESFHSSVEKLVAAGAAENRTVQAAAVTRCGHCAPRTYRICIDAKVL